MSPVEKELEVRLWERTFPIIRNTLLAASLLFLLFLGWDIRVDESGTANTMPERLLGAGCFALMYLLMTFTRIGRRQVRVIYISGVLLAAVLLLAIMLQIEGVYVLAQGSFLAIAMAVIVIGPTLRISIPLVLAVLLVPGAVVLGLAHWEAALPGVPDFHTAVSLALLNLGMGPLAVVLLYANDRLQHRMLMDNLHYEQLAGTDPLTAVQNRRQLQAEFTRERARQRRHGLPIGVLEIDIDHFKRVNDAHGHGVGDEVLRALTQRWRGLVREVDILARIGGEEFVVLLPESSTEGACESAERLRVQTAAEPVSTSVGALPVTISIGVALAAADDGDLDAVLKRVDRALYRAKANGRNRCEFSDPAEDAGEIGGTEPG